ncbi:hypothetical protein NW762_003109 [Fusarium torreyae]|uniref:Uncharacterized protein n=1 Tax=Fusarium torreyae TaxID=1237075 RepID=A0A9W8S8M5_9HYPO|nr:hypothetical protein NW762_003109 [Fusarium torreyae]
MSTKPLVKTTTLKRSRAQTDDQDDNDVGNKGSPETPVLRSDSHMDEECWQESLYSYSLHDNKTPRDVTWIDPRADSKLQDALKFLPPKAQLGKPYMVVHLLGLGVSFALRCSH